MLSNVTWGQYIEGMIILFFIYYVYIGLKYYREDIKSLFDKLTKANAKRSTASTINDGIADEAFEELGAVMSDLGTAILVRAERGISKELLLERLQERLCLYSGLHRPAYRLAINNYIIRNAKEICGVMFSEDELNSA